MIPAPAARRGLRWPALAGWAAAGLALAGLLLALDHVLEQAVRQGDWRRTQQAALNHATWECRALRSAPARAECLGRLQPLPVDNAGWWPGPRPAARARDASTPPAPAGRAGQTPGAASVGAQTPAVPAAQTAPPAQRTSQEPA